MTVHNSHSFKKLDKYSQESINLAIQKLQKRYKEYRKQNIVITNLFGDDIIIHDIVDDGFYVYKCRARNIQVRLLYEVNDKGEINVIDYCIKNTGSIKPTMGKRQTRYLREFSKSVSNYKDRRSMYNETCSC